MAAPSALPADVARLRERLLKDQAPSARARTQVYDPAAFIARHGRPYSSLKLPISTLKEMRTDATLRFAQLIALVSIFSAKWHIECANPQKAQFVDQALRRVIGRMIVQFYESWNFGWQTLVKEFGLMVPGWEYVDPKTGQPAKVWEGPYPALVWEPFVMLPPQTVAPVWTPQGAFNGVALSQTGGLDGAYGLPMIPFHPGDFIDVPSDVSARFTDQDDRQRKIPVENALWVTNEKEGQWGSVWGFSRLAYAFKYWWSYELTLGILNRSVEKKGDPTIVVSFPTGSSMVDGQEVSNRTIAFQIGEMARSGSVLAVPSEVWGDDMGSANQAPKWKIEPLKLEQDFDALIRVLEYYDGQKFQSMLVSELAVAEGSGGTSSRNVAATVGERTAEAQIFSQMEWDDVINRYMIPQLADANFPELRDEPARKVTQAFGENESALAADILRSYANSDATKLPVDKIKLLNRFQIDALEGEQLAEFNQRNDQLEKQLVDRAQNSRPEAREATPGGAAGVVDTGFSSLYYAVESISLAEDDVLLASLPKTKVYADRTVLAQTRLVRKLWKDALAAAYEDFAAHVAKAQLELEEEPRAKAEAVAAKLVDAWRYSYAKVIKTVALALSKILARAGRIELAASRLKTDDWKPAEDDDVVAWARDNAAALVRSIDSTTRDQLRTFLANEIQEGHGAEEIAANLRVHFAEFPDWRADLIAREETKRFYNAGTIFAAESAGATLQALDALKGPTDHECHERNGRVFDVAAAWQETDKEHVRGTLCWRIVPGTELSFSHVPTSEMGEQAVRVDPEKREILLSEGLDPKVEGDYLVRAIDWLISNT